ncbi:hypothetical protein AB0M20_37720, partial [Actinoplanes sp. NPDC051633]|uniref:hypothetical protein n=1 Tax=Actinoplanes sp. NPDC051633 TaxID=3155670 RepID=UPI003425B720
WLHPQLGTTTHAPRAYLAALQHVAVTLNADAGWRRWWQGSGTRSCELGIVAEERLDHLRPSADIVKAGDRVRANFTSTLPAGATDLVGAAKSELRGMFEVIREAIGLTQLPPIPAVPALPPEAHNVEVTARPLPAGAREQDQQGYLTLTQIQEFFR